MTGYVNCFTFFFEETVLIFFLWCICSQPAHLTVKATMLEEEVMRMRMMKRSQFLGKPTQEAKLTQILAVKTVEGEVA